MPGPRVVEVLEHRTHFPLVLALLLLRSRLRRSLPDLLHQLDFFRHACPFRRIGMLLFSASIVVDSSLASKHLWMLRPKHWFYSTYAKGNGSWGPIFTSHWSKSSVKYFQLGKDFVWEMKISCYIQRCPQA